MTPTTAFGWQDVATLALILTAAAYVTQGFWRRSARKAPGCGPGGGGCSGCPSNSGRPEGPGCSEPVTIGVGPLKGAPNVDRPENQVTSRRR